MKAQGHSIGIDVGTSGCKITILREDGSIVANAFREYSTSCPRPLWSEQNPDHWYGAVIAALRESLEKGKVRPSDVAAICLNGQPHTLVLLDEQDRTIRPAIVWTDQRSAAQSNQLKNQFGDLIFETGCNQVNPTWTISMLAWIRENEPETWGKIRKIMLPKDYVRFRLTGGWATDWTDAVGTLLADARKKEWSDELCRIIKLPRAVLPDILPPMSICGSVSGEASIDIGVREGTPVVTGATDPAAEVFGAGMHGKNQLAVKLATAGCVFVTTEEPRPHPCILTYPHVIPGLWLSLAATNSSGSALTWFRDVFCAEEATVAESLSRRAYEVMDAEAENVEPGSDGLVFHPYLLGERAPYWDPQLKASFTGIRMTHQRRHFIRSVLEGVSFSVKDCLWLIQNVVSDRGIERSVGDKVILLGGGAKSKLWSQIISDVLGMKLWKLEVGDASFGSALMGAVGTSMFETSQEAARKCIKISDELNPNPETSAYYEARFKAYKQVHDALAELYRIDAASSRNSN